jgi:ABC-type branched-subunit amino acid transport system ATPase component/predicted MFS family arabinose efflux permease
VTDVLRPPVPSEREQAAGAPTPAAPQTPAFSTTPGVVEKASWRTWVRGFIADMNPHINRSGHSARPFWVMVSEAGGQGVAAGTLAASFLVMRRDLGISDSALVGISGLFGVAGAALGPFAGWFADHFSRVKIALVSGLIWAGVALMFGIWPGVVGLVIMKMVQGVVGGFAPIGVATTVPLLSDYYPPEIRGRVIGAKAAIGASALLPGTLLGGAVASTWGWRPAVILTGFISLLGTLPWFTLREPARGRWDRLYLGASEEVANREQTKPSFGESMRAALAVRTLRRITYAEMFLSAGGPVLTPLLLIIVTRTAGIEPFAVAVMFCAQQVMTSLGLSFGGTLVDRLLADKPGRVMTFVGIVQLGNLLIIVLLAFVANPVVGFTVALIQPAFSATPIAAKDTLLSLVIPARLRSFGLQLPKLFGLLGLLCLPLAMAVTSGGDVIRNSIIFSSPFLAVGVILYLTSSVDVAKDIEDARLAALTSEEMHQTGHLLLCRQVDVHYDGVQVLFDVDFEVAEGELVALLGTNGAGKSTLLRAIAGQAPVTGGSIYLDSRDITRTPAHELAKFGIVQMPGGKGVFPNLTVRENLTAAGWLDGAGLNERVDKVLELFPALRERLDLAAGALSGGEQQMVALGQALIMRPKLLLIDELSLGLAPAIVEQLLQAVEEIHRSGTAIVLVEQSVNIALTVADRAVFMEKGEVRFSGPTDELLARPDIIRSVYLKGTTSGAAVPTRLRNYLADDRATVLNVEDAHVSYGGVKALAGASVQVTAGEIVGIIGPNGAGKTTLFDAVSGFVPITQGRIAISGGKDVTALTPDQRARLGLGRSFQDARLFPSLTVLETITVAMERHTAASRSAVLAALWLPQVRKAERKLRNRAEGLIELLGLGDYREKFVSELSTGSRRIVDLACEMAADPDVLLLDEPSSGIAQAEAEELGPVLDRVRRETGCGLLVIEHDMRLLTSIADRMVGMVRGETIVEGSVADVTEDPRIIDAYLGTSDRVLARSGQRQKRSN